MIPDPLKSELSRLRTAFDLIGTSIFIHDDRGRFLDVNEEVVRRYGYAREELLRMTVKDLDANVREEDIPGWMERFRVAPLLRFESVHRTKDGGAFPVEVSVHMVPREEGRLFFSIVQDISVRKETEAALRESQERLRRLAAHQQETVEAERSRIAREVHDELAQRLTVQRMDLVWLRRRLPAANPELHPKIDEILEGMEKTREVLGKIIREIRPRILDDLGLAPTLEYSAQDFREKTGIDVTLSLPQGEIPVDSSVATHLYRIAQEALTNVARHANASRVILSLSAGSGRLTLSVQDDGSGYAPGDREGRESFGILGMRERTAHLGGTLEISTLPGGGTLLTASVPLFPPPPAGEPDR